MNKQKIEMAIGYLDENYVPTEHYQAFKNICLSALQQQLTNGWIPEVMKEILTADAVEIILSSPDEFKKWLERGIWNCNRLNELSNCNNGWIPVDSKPDSDRPVEVTARRKTGGRGYFVLKACYVAPHTKTTEDYGWDISMLTENMTK